MHDSLPVIESLKRRLMEVLQQSGVSKHDTDFGLSLCQSLINRVCASKNVGRVLGSVHREAGLGYADCGSF